MKMVYTIEELQALSTEEIEKLSCFGGHSEHLYTNIVKFIPDTNSILMADGTSLECLNLEVLNSHKARKLRYDMLQSTLAGINQNNASKDSLRKEITDTVMDQISVLKDTFNITSNEAAEVFKKAEARIHSTVSTIERNFKNIEEKLDAKLKKIDAEQFGPKMKKLDKIIDIFKDFVKN